MRHLSVDGLFELFAHHPHAKVLDVRFRSDLSLPRASGIHHVPWFTPEWEPDPDFLARVLKCLSSEDHVLVICQNGEISCLAAAMLEKCGFRHVYNVLGGYEDIKFNARSRWMDLLHSRGPSGGHRHEHANS